MTSHSLCRATGALAAVFGLALFLPASATAQPIRVLLVMPSESGKLPRQVARLHRALAAARGPLVRAITLAEADAIVEFTGFRHAIDEQGVSHDTWEGEFKLLASQAHEAAPAPAIPERFRLLVFGRESWEVEPAVALLEWTLARALGREPRSKKQPPV